MTDAISTYGNAECVTHLADWRRSDPREIAVVLWRTDTGRGHRKQDDATIDIDELTGKQQMVLEDPHQGLSEAAVAAEKTQKTGG